MKWYLVTYDLNTPGKDYARLHSKICQIANGYCNILKSVWIIGHNGTAQTIFNQLLPSIDQK